MGGDMREKESLCDTELTKLAPVHVSLHLAILQVELVLQGYISSFAQR